MLILTTVHFCREYVRPGKISRTLSMTAETNHQMETLEFSKR
jgi:hypothetical protein